MGIPECGVGVKVVDQDAEIAGDDVGLSGVGRQEEINGVESAVPDIDVSRAGMAGSVAPGLSDGDFLRTKCGEGGVLGRVGGDDVDTGVVDAEEKVETFGFENSGMVGLPMGTLPEGTILKNWGGLGRPGGAGVRAGRGKLTAELSQVL